KGNTANVTGQVNVYPGGDIELEDGRFVAAGEASLYGFASNQRGVIVGPGTIDGHVNNQGFLATGNSVQPGTLHITGNYVQSGNFSQLFMSIIDDGSQYDHLVVGNSMTLGDGSNPTSALYISLSPSQLTQDTFPDVITYASISGTFNISATSGKPLFATYGATSIKLTTYIPAPAGPPEQPSLDSVPGGGQPGQPASPAESTPSASPVAPPRADGYFRSFPWRPEWS